jgi:S1-C subfamily serine protease
MVVDGRQIRASIAYQHPQADLTILRTATGKPPLPFSHDRLAVDQTGFSFGYPTGVLGATQDALMGRGRMRLGGRLSGITPTLTWAETQRFPDTLETLGGMSGGPMLDAQGRVIGIVVAAASTPSLRSCCSKCSARRDFSHRRRQRGRHRTSSKASAVCTLPRPI